MRRVARSASVAILAVLAAVVMVLSSIFMGAVSLAAVAIIVPGTGTPDPTVPDNYMNNAVDYYVVPNAPLCATTCTAEPAPYIAEFWPIPLPGWGGLTGAKWNVSVQSGVNSALSKYYEFGDPDNDENPGGNVVIFGYSQGATVTSLVKGIIANGNMTDPGQIPEGTQFSLIGNPQRPNGGFFSRWAILGTVPILDATFGNPTPNTGLNPDGTTNPDVPINTWDTALQYDGVADFPLYPINLLATANALAGFQYIHGTYLAPDDGEDENVTPYGYTPAEIIAIEQGCKADPSGPNCQRYGDTVYITLPAKTLPIMQPFLDLGAATGTSALVIPVVDLVSPFTQTLIETGYDRGNYGVSSPVRLIPRINPVRLAGDLINDIPEGINAALNPGLDPLPGSTPTPSVTTSSTPEVAGKQADPSTKTVTKTETDDKADARPLSRPSLLAIPGLGLKNQSAKSDQPNASSDSATTSSRPRPVRDALKNAADTVKSVVQRITASDKAAKKTESTDSSADKDAA